MSNAPQQVWWEDPAGLSAWMWRVRRDILALEYVQRYNWNKLLELFRIDPHSDELPLSPTEDLAVTRDKVGWLLDALGYPPNDPGPPPLPPW
jgi:hypothetical protein